MNENLDKFFEKLSERVNRENRISDLLWAMLESSQEFRKIFAEVIDFPNKGKWDIKREYHDEKTKGRPDFLIASSEGEHILIEIKIFDRNYHYNEYSKIRIDHNKPKIALISSHKPYKQLPGWTVILWNDLIKKLKQSENELIIAFSKYLRRATMSEKINKVTFQKPVDILYLNRMLKKTIENYGSEKCSCEIYHRTSTFTEFESGYCFFLQDKNEKELDVWLYFCLVYYDEYQGIQLWLEKDWTQKYDAILHQLRRHYNGHLREEDGSCFILIEADKPEFKNLISANSAEDQQEILKTMFNEFIQVIEKIM